MIGLRDRVGKTGFSKVVIGLSGGFDSAYTAAVAVDALGADNVLLVRMPSALTGSQSMDDAEEAARLLGATMRTVSVGGVVDATRAALADLFGEFRRTALDVTEENQQARARGAMILMSISNKLGHMLITTGNKSEMATGYATLYGDMDGGFSILKDVWKTDAYELALWRNKARPRTALGPEGVVVPERIIKKMPSAELAENQMDANSLGSYWVLDPFLRHLVEQHETVEVAVAMARIEARATISAMDDEWRTIAMVGAEVDADGLVVVTEDYGRRMAARVRNSQHKREQAPPGVVLTNRDFGPGWRLPNAGGYTL